METILTSLVSCRSVDEAAVGAWIQIWTWEKTTKTDDIRIDTVLFPTQRPHLFTHSFSSIFVPSQGLASPQLLPNKLQISAVQPDLPGQNFSNFACCVM